MFVRYSTTAGGGLKKKALVYTREEHGISRRDIDPDALKIIERLRDGGHQGYVVGGAVRDLMVGRTPKDFDIVTDATPGRIKKLFWNARIIGRRFRLVHVFFGQKILELATFRSIKEGSVGNEYGTMDEDVQRRDYTFNALYYDPRDELVIDYVGGVEDIRKKRVVPLIPLKTIFKEDPVRMIRAIKYAASTGFRLPLSLRLAIARQASLLEGVSVSRLSEEVSKMLGSGRSRVIFEGLIRYRLLPWILPAIASAASSASWRSAFLDRLSALDDSVSAMEEKRLGRQLPFVLSLPLSSAVDWKAPPQDAYHQALAAARDAFHPMNLPRVELELAVRQVFRERGIPLLQKHL